MDGPLLKLAWLGAVALVSIAILLGVRSELTYRQDTARQAEVQADILAASVGAALAFDDHAAMTEYVGALRVNARIAAAGVYDPRGLRLVSFARPGADPPPPTVAGPATRFEQRRVRVTRAVTEGGAKLGSVFLETSAEPWADVLARHAGMALLTVMAFSLLGLLTDSARRLQSRARQLALANTRLREEMSARGKAEEALRQGQKMEALGQLTGGIAHDFNNLLQVVHGALEMMRRKPADPKVPAWIETALIAAERGATLTRQLLTFSRSQKLELRPFVVADLVAEMRDMLAQTLGANIALTLRLEDGGASVRSDRTQVELAVLNTAINARDAMVDGGQVTISTRIVTIPQGHANLESGDYLELRIADTGPGMPDEVVARAFDPFFTTKGVGKGTGLGLSQVYGVAHQAGGEARIESTPGGGATVVMMLRRSIDAARASEVLNAEALAAPLQGTSVLVVDDEAQVRALTSETLRYLGYEVFEADSGQAALALLQTLRPDVVLMDYLMPGMNGAQVAEQARKLWPDLPIVFASGHADTSAVEQAVGGEAKILRKPFDIDSLARAVAEAI